MDNDSNNRQFVIEVTGWRGQPMKRMGNYTIKVPYYRLSQTLQQINRQGAKIKSVEVLSSVLSGNQPQPQASEPTIIPSPTQLETKKTIFSAKTTRKLRHTSKLRRHKLKRARMRMTRRVLRSTSREKSEV